MKKIVKNQEIIKAAKKIGNKLNQIFIKEKEDAEKQKKKIKIPVVIGVLKGAIHFMMDVVKNIKFDILIDYLQISSYKGFKAGKIILKKDIEIDINDRTVVLVEDVISSGASAKFLFNYLQKYNPKRIIFITLIDEVDKHSNNIKVDYCVKKIYGKNANFLLGYGLDFNEFYRNWLDVYQVNEKEIVKNEFY